jgi:hypothetical protein
MWVMLMPKVTVAMLTDIQADCLNALAALHDGGRTG